jgi:AraC-like DNA-binding protein
VTELNAITGISRFSTDALPSPDRLPMWREFYARKLLRLEWEPFRDLPFRANVLIQTLPGLGIYRAACSPFRACLTSEFLVNDSDGIFLQMPMSHYVIAQARREVELAAGDATALSTLETCAVTNTSTSDRRVGLYFPRERLKPLLRDINAVLVRRIPGTAEPLRLLRAYVALLQREKLAPKTPELQHVAVTHIYDLAALALGATRDAAELAVGRGVAAARLYAIKTDVSRNLGRSDLSLSALAKRHGVTPRYVRALFEQEGTSCSDYIRERRLKYAHHLLTSPGYTHLHIIEIAYEAGFGDISNFNRAFRRRFGATPSEIRLLGCTSGM